MKRIPENQMAAWILLAVSAPLAQFSGGSLWEITAVSAVCLAVIYLLMGKRSDRETLPKWMAAAGYLWATLQLVWIFPQLQNCWPTAGAAGYIPYILLAIALLSAGKGSAAAAGASASLFWLVLLGFGFAAAASVGSMRSGWILTKTSGDIPELAAISLFPLSMLLLPGSTERKLPRWLPAITGMVLLFTICVNGVLFGAAAVDSPNAFFEMSRSINMFGFIQRVEAVVAAVMLISWFSLLSLQLSTAAYTLEYITGQRNWGMILAALLAVGGSLFSIQIKPEVLLAADGILALCLILPVEKRNVKKEKNMLDKRGNI